MNIKILDCNANCSHFKSRKKTSTFSKSDANFVDTAFFVQGKNVFINLQDGRLLLVNVNKVFPSLTQEHQIPLFVQNFWNNVRTKPAFLNHLCKSDGNWPPLCQLRLGLVLKIYEIVYFFKVTSTFYINQENSSIKHFLIVLYKFFTKSTI